MMKVLLITPYWRPYNVAGAFRWLGMNTYLKADVLTMKIPRRGHLDETMPLSCFIGFKIFKVGTRIPAIIWGLLASFVALFKRYDIYIFSAPPETLIIGAWIHQLLGRTVVIDRRDNFVDGKEFGLMFKYVHRLIVPIYKLVYKRLKNKITCWKFIDPEATIIYHGYHPVNAKSKQVQRYYTEKIDHNFFLEYLRWGVVPSYKGKPEGYGSSSYPTIKQAGFVADIRLHPEVENHTPVTYVSQAKKLIKYLETL